MQICRVHLTKWVILPFMLLSILITACAGLSTTSTETAPGAARASGQDQVFAQLEFKVNIPEPIASPQKLTLEILDEVTGLALNPTRYPMKKADETNYSLTLPIPPGSVLKYRYIREGGVAAVEYTSQGRQVRYRMYYVQNPGVVSDIVSAWNDKTFSGAFGRIQGHLLDAAAKTPVVGSLVAAGGQQTITASDGSFLLDGITPGKHNLVVYSLDGTFPPFQQEAVVAADSNTSAEMFLSPAKMVTLTFQVKTSDDLPEGIPLRMIGNIYPLGNTFADLRGGISSIASRAPMMVYQKDRIYNLKLKLPAGLDLRYKYTLGDGFWNSERKSGAKFKIRQLIVPEKDTVIQDSIEAFTTPGAGALTFNLTTAASVAKDEVVSIQFNPYGWTEPIPMWNLGDQHWIYILYTPLDADVLSSVGYRYCRNDQCGIADDAATVGQDIPGKPFKVTAQPQVIKDTVKQWAWTPEQPTPITVPSDSIPAKPEGFVAGIELLPDYHPSWQPYTDAAFTNIKELKADWVFLSPTWHFTSQNPPVLAQVPGVDPTWYDLSQMAIQARQKGLKLAVHPGTAYFQPATIWWQSASRDASWWQSWFDRYETFLLTYADFAAQSGADAFIIGDENIAAALPGGQLAGGNPSQVPDDAEQRWLAMIEKVRVHYNGKLILRTNYSTASGLPAAVIGSVDQLYVVLDGSLTDVGSPDSDVLKSGAEAIINDGLQSLRDQYQKPIIIGISYPSVVGAANGCIKSGEACLPAAVFDQAGLDVQSAKQDLVVQANIYNGILAAVNQNDWIQGVVASGYYPAVGLQDKSFSVRGKPSADVIWFWFSQFLAAQP